MKDARSDAVRVDLKGHARRFHIGARRPANWLELVRFCVVGGSGYVINVGLFWLAYRDLPYMVAFMFAFAVAATNNFIWNRVWTFGARQARILGQSLRALTVSALSLGANQLFLVALVAAGAGHLPAQAVAIVLVTPFSFAASKLWAFAGDGRSRAAETLA